VVGIEPMAPTILYMPFTTELQSQPDLRYF
jgi:hypothetical protein